MPFIRRVVENDLERAHRLLEQLMPAAFALRRAIWRDTLAQDGYAAWIAEVDGQAAGFIDLYLFPDVGHGRTIGLVNNLVVDARFRRRGLGEDLLKEATAYCRQHDVVELHVWTDSDNDPALHLYERAGFARRAVLLELEM
ncbi:MAG: GNAT family N-acetyltransferase [bacterium]